MPGVHKKIEIVGTSPVSSSDAIKQAVAEAGKTIQHMEWFEVKEIRGRIHGGEVAEYQVTIQIGFKL